MSSHRTRRTLMSMSAVALVASLALLGCGAEEPEEEPFGTQETLPGQQTMPETSYQQAPVEVTLTEYEIQMPATLPSGPTTFQIRNQGAADHNFEIEGQGLEQELPQDLAPGESGTLQVNLEPGSYTIYCPVGDHRDQGMEMTLTVVSGEPTPIGAS